VAAQCCRRLRWNIHHTQLNLDRAKIKLSATVSKLTGKCYSSMSTKPAQEFMSKPFQQLITIGAFGVVSYATPYGWGTWKSRSEYAPKTYDKAKMCVSISNASCNNNIQLIQEARGEECTSELANTDPDVNKFFEFANYVTDYFCTKHYALSTSTMDKLRKWIVSDLTTTKKKALVNKKDTFTIEEDEIKQCFERLLRLATVESNDDETIQVMKFESYILKYAEKDEKDFHAKCSEGITQEMIKACEASANEDDKGEVHKRVPAYAQLYRCGTEQDVRDAIANGTYSSKYVPFFKIPHTQAHIEVGDIVAPIYKEVPMEMSPAHQHWLTHEAVGYLWLGRSDGTMSERCEEALNYKTDLHPSTYFHMAQAYDKKIDWEEMVNARDERLKKQTNSTKGMKRGSYDPDSDHEQETKQTKKSSRRNATED
jgi:hypothetical protein